jgi:hypothetical protein
MRLSIRNLLVGMASCSAVILCTNLAVSQMAPAPRPTSPSAAPGRTVGQVDRSKPIDVMVMNNTSAPLSVGFSGGAKIKIDPKEKTTVSFESVPVSLFVYPFAQNVSTKYNTTISGNTISVEVVPLNSVTPGEGSINVNRSGTVYIF